MQYVLDNFADVAEAVAWIEESRLQMVGQTDPATGREVTLHLALDDVSGDSAITEYLDGTPTIHHGRAYTVMTNWPPFDEQLERLGRVEGFGGSESLLDPSDGSPTKKLDLVADTGLEGGWSAMSPTASSRRQRCSSWPRTEAHIRPDDPGRVVRQR